MEKIPFIYNAIEIGIWAAFATGFMLAAVKRDGSTRIRCVFASLLFLFFGASDAVELYTGAWWKPWWLLVWKALCVISLIALYFDNVTSRVQLSKEAASASDASDDGQQ